MPLKRVHFLENLVGGGSRRIIWGYASAWSEEPFSTAKPYQTERACAGGRPIS